MVWFRFRMLRRYLAYASEEAGRIYRMLDFANEGCPAHGPFISWCRVLLIGDFLGLTPSWMEATWVTWVE